MCFCISLHIYVIYKQKYGHICGAWGLFLLIQGCMIEKVRRPLFERSWHYAELVNKLPVFYGPPVFIAVFIIASHWSLFWARWNQCTPQNYIFLIYALILSNHLRLGLASGIIPSGFSTNILCSFIIFPM